MAMKTCKRSETVCQRYIQFASTNCKVFEHMGNRQRIGLPCRQQGKQRSNPQRTNYQICFIDDDTGSEKKARQWLY